jgi:hypothetical protein
MKRRAQTRVNEIYLDKAQDCSVSRPPSETVIPRNALDTSSTATLGALAKVVQFDYPSKPGNWLASPRGLREDACKK